MARRPQRRYGAIRKLPSGRYQVRYLAPDGRRVTGSETYSRRTEAERYLALMEAELAKGQWLDPTQARIPLQEYAERWITQRPRLRPRTVHLYRWTLGKHITPYLGSVEVGRLTTPMIRKWRADLLAAGVSESGAAKAYRLLRAVLMTAVKEDELIRVNPCRIPGADQERSAERPVLSVGQVLRLADRVLPRYRAMILVTTFASLRWGEVTALHRGDVDLTAGTVRVRWAFSEINGQGLVLGPPKSRAGRRTVTLPRAIVEVLAEHINTYCEPGADALVFTTESGRPHRASNFRKLVHWRDAVTGIGAPDLHFHDLRHTGNTLAAQTGTSLRDLMTRMGHDSPRAALIYQHASSAADHAIAQALQKQLE